MLIGGRNIICWQLFREVFPQYTTDLPPHADQKLAKQIWSEWIFDLRSTNLFPQASLATKVFLLAMLSKWFVDFLLRKFSLQPNSVNLPICGGDLNHGMKKNLKQPSEYHQNQYQHQHQCSKSIYTGTSAQNVKKGVPLYNRAISLQEILSELK